jgi:argininosuccinate lyase
MKNKKLWGGRFRGETSQLVDAFNASVGFDWKLYPYDIAGSIAHAQTLGRRGILSKSDVAKIVRGLKSIREEIERGAFRWDVAKEDVHLNVEARLTARIGDAGARLHTARSRNDQVATDLRLYCRDQVRQVVAALADLQEKLVGLAEKNVDTLMPGYTHLQRAQPISLAHHLLAFFEMARRDVDRLLGSLPRIDVLPLGAGALAGTTFPLDRKFAARALGFSSVSANSLDAVSDRDFAIEALSHLSLIMMHLSRLAEEWILWSTQEFQFVELPESFCTGSSMMPQKMNPDVLELIRGKTGRVYGALLALLTILKGLPLAYNKDLQEDKEPLFDAFQTTLASLRILAALAEAVRFKAGNMKRALNAGFVLATDVADYLAARGIPFRQAHRVAGEIVRYCQKAGKELKDLQPAEWRRFHPRFGKDIRGWLDNGRAVDRRSSAGGTARKNVRREIQNAKKIIRETKKKLGKMR